MKLSLELKRFLVYRFFAGDSFDQIATWAFYKEAERTGHAPDLRTLNTEMQQLIRDYGNGKFELKPKRKKR